MQTFKGFKYRTYPHIKQQNSIYNIYLTLQQKQCNKKKTLNKKNRIQLKPSIATSKTTLNIIYDSCIKNTMQINSSLNINKITNNILIFMNFKTLNYNKYSKVLTSIDKT